MFLSPVAQLSLGGESSTDMELNFSLIVEHSDMQSL